MYKPIIPSIIFGESVSIGFAFDVASFEDLVNSNVKAVNRSIEAFKRGSKGMRKDDLMIEIGIYMEILEKGIFLSLQEKNIVFKDETKKAVKQLFTRVSSFIRTLGDLDSDFCSLSITERATPSREVLMFLQEKW